MFRSFYNQNAGASAPSAASRTALTKLFEKYAGRNDEMGIEQMMPYFQQINADPAGVSSIVVSEIVKSPEFGTIKKDGFVDGWAELGCDTIDKQKKFLDNRTKTLSNPANREVLKAVYKFAFELNITSAAQRLVDKDTLIEFWRLVFSPPGLDWRTKNNNWLDLWLEFVSASSHKAFNRDAWTQTFRFAEETLKDETLSWWDEASSWPALIDEFVEWIKEKRGIGKTNGDEDEDMEY